MSHVAQHTDIESAPGTATTPAFESAPLNQEHTMTSPVMRKSSRSSDGLDEKNPAEQQDVRIIQDEEEVEEARTRRHQFYVRYRPFILGALAAVILGWWISATVLPSTRHRWIVQTVWAWFFIIIIAFRFIPNTVVSRPVEAIWQPLVSRPFLALPKVVRYCIGWFCLVAIVFGSAFGFPLDGNSTYGDRAISVVGLIFFQALLYITSTNRAAIPWRTVIVGLFVQQAIALFVLKSGAGFDIFKWIADLAATFLSQSEVGAAFFFSTEVVAQSYFFVNTLAAIIFFVAVVQMLYYLGVMQWVIKNFAWFFYKTMNISGAESVVAAGSPWIGQGESACLVRPYVDLMTESELHLTMTSGFATISGSLFTFYISLGVPPANLVTSSVMSIPAAIAISKMRLPETEEPVTRGRVVVDRGDNNPLTRPANALHAFSKGALFGLIVAGQILTNVLTILSLVALINAFLTWVGLGFHIENLTLQLVLGYIFYPLTFFLGVPRHEILRVSQIIATKVIANEFVGYSDLHAIMQSSNPLSYRAFQITTYSLCGFANIGSVGIQIGVLSALAPSRAKIIARIAFSAMICGFISTMQTAAIAGMLL